MIASHVHFVRHMVSRGLKLRVNDGGAIIACATEKASFEAIHAVDESTIVVTDSDNNRLGWAHIVLQQDEAYTVCDFSDNEFMRAWDLKYTEYENERAAKEDFTVASWDNL